MIDFNIGFVPDEPEDLLERAKQEIANAIDSTPGLAKDLSGKTWNEIFEMLRYYER